MSVQADQQQTGQSTAGHNIGSQLSEMAAIMPDAIAIAVPGRRRSDGTRDYKNISLRGIGRRQ